MRFSGRLHTWNDRQGYGFIRPDGGGQDIFVHISALPVPRPQPDEVLTFEVALNAQGKKKAMDVMRESVERAGLAADQRWTAAPPRPARSSGRRPQRETSTFATFVIGVLLVGALAWAGWGRFQASRAVATPAPFAAAPSASVAPAFRCDGRQHCSQMTSCAEATFFLKNCPGVKMDGDNDGIACEQQWC